MLKILIRNQIRSVFAPKKTDKKRGKAASIGSYVLIGVLVLLLAAIFLGMFAGLFYMLALPLHEAGLDWFYFALAALLSFALSVFCTVFYAQPQIYGAKDNDLLLAMPIKPSQILASRLVVLYGEALLTAAISMVPAGVIWCLDCPVTFLGTVFFVLGTLLVAALSMAVALVVGAVVAWIVSHLKWKNLFSILGFLFFFLIYFWGMEQVEIFIDNILTDPSAYADGVRGLLYPAYAFGAACAEQKVGLFLIFVLIALAPAALVCWILSLTFLRLITTKRGDAKVKYRRRAMRASSPLWAFTKKELRHLTSNASYLINAAAGIVMLPVLSVMVLVTWSEMEFILSQIPDATVYVTLFLPLIPCLIAATVLISSATVSTEGKNLWIAQSAPCAPGDILIAKALSHIAVACPVALISSLILAAVVPNGFALAAVIAVPQLFIMFTAFFGVFINLLMPKLDYENDVAAVKRGTPGMITMLVGMALCILPIVLAFKTTLSVYLILSALTVVLIGIDVALYCYLRTAGGRRFMSL